MQVAYRIELMVCMCLSLALSSVFAVYFTQRQNKRVKRTRREQPLCLTSPVASALPGEAPVVTGLKESLALSDAGCSRDAPRPPMPPTSLLSPESLHAAYATRPTSGEGDSLLASSTGVPDTIYKAANGVGMSSSGVSSDPRCHGSYTGNNGAATEDPSQMRGHSPSRSMPLLGSLLRGEGWVGLYSHVETFTDSEDSMDEARGP